MASLYHCYTNAKLTIKVVKKMIFEFGRYIIDVNVAKTKAFYDSDLSFPTNDVCSCAMCQHFPKAILSSSDMILNFLYSLGINPVKAGEVFGSSDAEQSVDRYSGWYHIVGTILEGRLTSINYDDTNAFVPDTKTNFKVWFIDDTDKMGWIQENFPDPVLEVSFSAVLPTPSN